ncbi:MAG: hypothetical protein F6K58_09070 [Symploca sp. SIO2E9]|nr:hypothetical protein [Symploca sp. SIO2E9]
MVSSQNQNSLNTLIRAISRSGRNFSLILARCNYGGLREQIAQQLQEECPVEIKSLVLKYSIGTLYSTIAAELGQEEPTALMVFGLESVIALEQVLRATNQMREEFRKFSFPLVFWVNDQILQKLIRLVPDFEGWATTVEFQLTTEELVNFIKQTTDQVFAQVLDPNASIFLDNAVLNLNIVSPIYREIESAQAQLKRQGISLDPELEASLEFVLGRHANDSLETSQQHYQRSLELWQQTKNTERYGCLLFYLGLWWRTYLLEHRDHSYRAYLQAKDNFQQAVWVLEHAKRLDLVGKFINALCDSLQRLRYWDELEEVAKKALALHQQGLQLFRLARAYGFLAEVALAKSDFSGAKAYAQLALFLLANAQDENPTPVSAEEIANLDGEMSLHQGWYLFSLAKAQSSLGKLTESVNILEDAKATTKSQYDPELYIQILEELRALYFQQGDYLQAFHIKQQRRSIEHQYGFRAFIGAGKLQPKQQATNPALPHIQQQGTVAPEIEASGRQQDVYRLIQRLGRDDCKLTVIHGQSGVGKSSLVQAGLIPTLKQQPLGTREVLPVLQQVYSDWIPKLGKCLAQALVETQNCSCLPSSTEEPSPYPGITLSCDFDNMSEPVTLDSTTAILQQLQRNAANHFLNVLIFDQFEEFFLINKDPAQRKIFYDFLRDCLEISYVKVILSLREDHLSYLLECTRYTNLEILNNDILDRNILFYFGNFSPLNAKSIIKNFTKQANFHLEPELIDELVKDLAEELGEVRPIELQVVGAQLQAEEITTLAKYRRFGPKAKLVERFLEQVIKDCGPENENVARLVLYLLTDENGTRPFKHRQELEQSLSELAEAEKLDLVLEILVKSGLVVILPEVQTERYQLVHDYLVVFIRKQQNLLSRLQKQRRELLRKQAEILRKQAEIKRLRRVRWFLGAAVAVGITLAVFASWAERQRQRALTSEIKAHADSSEALFAVDKPFEALLEGLIAAKQLKYAPWAETDTIAQVLTELRQAVYGTQEYNRLEDHKSTVYRVSFSPNGKTIASASSDRTVKLWSNDGKLLKTLEGHADGVIGVSFSPDGKMIASASLDETVKLWSIRGKELNTKEFKTLEEHTGNVLSVIFSPDGQTIASASEDKTIKLWSRNGNLKATFKGHTDSVRDLSFSPDGQTLASASFDGTVKLWSIDGRVITTFPAHNANVLSVSFSPDGQTLASASFDGTIKLWGINGNLLQTLAGHEDAVSSVSFSPDGKTIASASTDRTIKLWSSQGNLLKTLKGHQYWVNSVSFSPDGKTLVSASGDFTVRLWNLNSIAAKTLRGHQGRISKVSFSPDGQIIASASRDGKVKLWNLDKFELGQAGERLRSNLEHDKAVWSASFSPDSLTLASAGADHTVKLWDLNGNLLNTLRSHRDSVLGVSFSPNGKLIASASRDKTIKLWSLDGKLLKTLTGHQEPVNWVSFSPNGQIIASASDDNSVKLWNLDGTLLKTLEGHSDWILDVNFSPDGKMIASASRDGKVKLWDLEGKELKTLELGERTNQDYSVSFSPTGNMIASASRDSTVKLWDLEGRLLIKLKGHQGAVRWVRFSPDGKMIASGGDDETVILWDLDNLKLNDLLAQGCNQVGDYLENNPNLSDGDRTLCNY